MNLAASFVSRRTENVSNKRLGKNIGGLVRARKELISLRNLMEGRKATISANQEEYEDCIVQMLSKASLKFQLQNFLVEIILEFVMHSIN